MKFAVAFLNQFARTRSDQSDVFEQRLKSLKAPVTKSRRPVRMSAPTLFRHAIRSA